MAYKPVGIDDASHFPPRVREALAKEFVTKPANISNGQVAIWDANSETWVAGFSGAGSGSGSTEWVLPPTIDGGVFSPETNTWVRDTTDWGTPPSSSDIDGGNPTSN